MTEMMKVWAALATAAWHERRNEDGGLTDDVALMAMLVAIAGVIAVALLGLLTGAVDNLDFTVPGT